MAPDAAPARGTRVAIWVANCVAWVADGPGQILKSFGGNATAALAALQASEAARA